MSEKLNLALTRGVVCTMLEQHRLCGVFRELCCLRPLMPQLRQQPGLVYADQAVRELFTLSGDNNGCRIVSLRLSPLLQELATAISDAVGLAEMVHIQLDTEDHNSVKALSEFEAAIAKQSMSHLWDAIRTLVHAFDGVEARHIYMSDRIGSLGPRELGHIVSNVTSEWKPHGQQDSDSHTQLRQRMKPYLGALSPPWREQLRLVFREMVDRNFQKRRPHSRVCFGKDQGQYVAELGRPSEGTTVSSVADFFRRSELVSEVSVSYDSTLLESEQ